MKKMNKKGFTLAELLIVIAIIAILIAIAIPSFSASLYRARLQADHANIRSAYAIYQTANLTGVLDDGSENGILEGTLTADGTYYFQQDGSLGTVANAYLLQVDSKSDADCAASIGCTSKAVHVKGNKIAITYTKSTGKWGFVLG